MLAYALLLAATPLQPGGWFGPAEVSFEAQFPGNPYDPDVNDVRVRFERKGSAPAERLAYFDKSAWKATLVAPQAGTYRAVLIRNGKPAGRPPQTVQAAKKLPDGYLRVDPGTHRFEFDSGKPYWPLGHNLGWQNADLIDLTEHLKKMSQNGLNWARIWACPWDGKNVYYPKDSLKLELGRFDSRAISRWDQVVKAAEGSGVRFQFVLFHHGLFSSTVNPNWPSHPWNAANGGFLKNAADFFTDPTARKLTKAWLRYAVARWGHSPSIMAWELFNEVEWVDARYQNRWKDIETWHGAMADYLRSLDPYRHLVTTSSAMDQPAVWAKMDYYQPHAYPPDVFSSIAGTAARKDKPLFYGEFGPGDYVEAKERGVVRDGIWGSVLACHAGAAQYWYWDRMIRQDLYDEFRIAARVMSRSGYATRLKMAPLMLAVESPAGANLEFGPGMGWAKNKKFEFRLPEEATAANLAQLSGFFNSQVGGNNTLFSKPLVFRFEAKQKGQFLIRLGTLAKNGAALKVYVNGQRQIAESWPAGDKDRPINTAVQAYFPAGQVEVQIENDGTDWVTFQGFSVEGIAPQVRGFGCSDGACTLIRLTAASGAKLPVEVGIGGLGLKDGTYRLIATELDTGAERTSSVQVKAGALTKPFEVSQKDLALVILGAP